MGRSLQLLAQVGSPHSAKCVSPPSLRTLTSTRKSVKRNVVVSWKGSGRTTGHAPTQGGTDLGMRAMTAMTGITTARAGLTTTTREKLRLTPLLWLSPSLMLMRMPTMATTDTAWGMPMGTPSAMLVLDMDMAMVWVTFTKTKIGSSFFD